MAQPPTELRSLAKPGTLNWKPYAAKSACVTVSLALAARFGNRALSAWIRAALAAREELSAVIGPKFAVQSEFHGVRQSKRDGPRRPLLYGRAAGKIAADLHAAVNGGRTAAGYRRLLRPHRRTLTGLRGHRQRHCPRARRRAAAGGLSRRAESAAAKKDKGKNESASHEE